jgi:ACS family hexuronate transporter-like MFS transporter
MLGGFGGMVFSKYAGFVLDKVAHSYVPLFVVAGSAYLVALLVVHLLMPKMEPVENL